MITTIIFDLSEVYLQGLKGVEKLIKNKLGTSLTSEDMFIPELEKLFHGEIPEREYWEALIAAHELSVTASELEILTRNNFKEIEGTRDLIQRLKDNGYRLGLLSIHVKEWVDHCEKEFDYHKLFDSIIYSFEVAICKPERKSYEMMLEKLDVKAEECVFIDDSEKNLFAAQQLGITTIQFFTVQQVEDELKQFGITL